MNRLAKEIFGNKAQFVRDTSLVGGYWRDKGNGKTIEVIPNL